MIRRKLVFLVLLVAGSVGAQEWRFRAERNGVAVAAIPLTTAQRIAFYGARGFTAGSIDTYAHACGFSFSLAHGGASTLRFSLVEWRAVSEGRTYRLRQAEEWESEWAKREVPEAARIAFRWAQFPSAHELAPGDWIMGMTVLDGRPPGRFRLNARYHNDKGSHDLILEDLACADDD